MWLDPKQAFQSECLRASKRYRFRVPESILYQPVDWDVSLLPTPHSLQVGPRRYVNKKIERVLIGEESSSEP